MNTNIAENIKRVRASIDEAAIKSGRAPGDILLVAAAKMNSADRVQQAIAAGVDAIGENRVQEMQEKAAQGAYSGAPLHFIGHLQSNKVGKVVGVCELIESVGSETLLQIIGNKAVSLGIVQKVLIEINIGREPRKSGVLPENLTRILELSSQTEGVNVAGLMAIPPISEENEGSCYFFDAMFKLFIDISSKKYDNSSMRFLSMGMSDSYVDAIHAGANMVRVGSAIFGDRA
ncbi:MAG: YggS family pyridoxal phosphate-dependent enzyme [Oscillospiraceae bacterium]|nr:YggS family pyridoxal phosphate-dependent enzyme [Oscillospiraceae bacterium]